MQNSDFSQQNSPATDSANTQRDVTTAVGEEAKTAYQSAVQTGKRVGETIVDEAKQMIGESVDEAKGQVQSVFSEQKVKAAESLDQVVGALRRTGQELSSGEGQSFAQYAEAAADQVERFSGYLKNHEMGELVTDLRDVARRQPEMFVAGALAAGFLLGRFLKSSGAQATASSYNQGGAYGQANYGQPATYGAQYGSTQYGSSPYGTTWEQSRPSTTQDIPISAQEDRYGR